jgi:hypothetical protein
MAPKPAIKINFVNFWSTFNKTENFFYNLLIQRYEVTISDDPDILFYTIGGLEHARYKCTKVFYTGENIAPNFAFCDFAFSYCYPVTKKNYRLPLYALYDDVTKYINRKVDARGILAAKSKFCCFIISNDKCRERNDFFNLLSKYKHVDSGGRALNNIGRPVQNKLEFIKDYKFVIAFENVSYPGYTTEKVFEPLQQHCVPIYWGDPLVGNDFNTKSFINCHQYASFDDAVTRIIEVDNNDDLYMQYLSEPMFKDNKLNEYVNNENILNRLDEIVAYHFNQDFKPRRYIRYPYAKVLTAIDRVKQSVVYVGTIPTRIIHKLKTAIVKS